MYKRYIKKEYPNTENFIKEMIYNLLFILDKYIEIKDEFNIDIQIIICFPYIPLPITDEYMMNFSKKTNTTYYKVISHKERLELWNLYCNDLIKMINKNLNYKNIIHIFDLRNIFMQKGLDYFSRKDCEDHHPDLSVSHIELNKILDEYIFYDKNDLPFKIKYNNWKKSHMYPHVRRPLI